MASPKISYAQNFEDVMLWRALGHVQQGTYVDIGAQDPLVDSVSLMFHEAGWKGIHVEPTAPYAQALREQRPHDVVIQAAVGAGTGMQTLFEIPNTGISTLIPEIAAGHRERGFEVCEGTTSVMPLSSVLETAGDASVHWMKIDVEGFESQVLSSWGDCAVRPWVVVVESMLPLTQIHSHASWEPLLLERGYTFVYFDGLNRFYVSAEHAELTASLVVPPNVFDNFALNGTASATFAHQLLADREARLKHAGEQAQAELARARAEAEAAAAVQMERQVAKEAKLQHMLSERTGQVRDAAGRERELRMQMADAQAQHAQELGRARAESEAAARQLLDASCQQVEHDRRFASAIDGLRQALAGEMRAGAQRESELAALQDATRRGDELLALQEQLVGGLRQALADTVSGSERRLALLDADRTRLREALAQVRASWIGRWSSRHVDTALDGGSDWPLAGPPDDPVRVKDADALMRLQGESFVRAAYLVVLGRQAEESGLNAYLQHLRAGQDRRMLLLDMSRSPEAARLRGRVALPGLDDLLRRYDRERPGHLRRLLQRRFARLLDPLFNRV